MKFSHFEAKSKEEQEMIELEGEFIRLTQKWNDLHRRMPKMEVQNYSLKTINGSTHLADLFGHQTEMMLIHNMGTKCSHCTLWADGFNGVLPHLESRCAFVVATPDDPETQRKFALSRDWKFRMVSHRDSTFSTDLGFTEAGTHSAGISILTKDGGGKIIRTTRTGFCPGDLYASIFHLVNLLPSAAAQPFSPKFRYFEHGK